MLTVVLLFGGRSSEHTISCATAGGGLSAIDRSKYTVIPVGITLDGAFTLQLSRTPKDIVIKSGGHVVERVKGKKRIHYKIACRDKATETLRITVRAKGAYTLKASYAG